MPGKVSPTLRALLEIRDRIGGLDTRLATVEGVLATDLVQIVAALHEVRDLLRDRLDLRDQVVDHEHRISALEARRS
jgi:hypothetical protein